MLTGSGLRRFRARRHVIQHGALAHQIPDVHISDKQAIRREVWDFDPLWEFEYSKRELMLMAEKILLNDPKPFWEEPYWLPAEQYMERLKREIYVAVGTPDPAWGSGLYWRTHPQGRRTNLDPARRRQGRRSFYR